MFAIAILIIALIALYAITKILNCFFNQTTVLDYKTSNTPWAIVTGASRGIGLEFCRLLAAKGFNIVLLSRNKARLDEIAVELSAYGIKTIVYPFDFARYDLHLYEALKAQLDPLNVNILVNNVGISHSFPKAFMDEDPLFIRNMIEINTSAQLEMCRLAIPLMKKQGKGLILNIGSMAGGVIPVGLLAPYSATKAFLKSFSIALSLELASDNIDVQHVNTYFVVSDMSKIKKSSWLVPTAKDYVDSVLKQVGKKKSITPYPSHAFVEFILGWIPARYILEYAFELHKKIRAKALKNEKRK